MLILRTNFSSRYVFQASIFMVLAAPVVKKDGLQIILGIAGAMIGWFFIIFLLYEWLSMLCIESFSEAK